MTRPCYYKLRPTVGSILSRNVPQVEAHFKWSSYNAVLLYAKLVDEDKLAVLLYTANCVVDRNQQHRGKTTVQVTQEPDL